MKTATVAGVRIGGFPASKLSLRGHWMNAVGRAAHLEHSFNLD